MKALFASVVAAALVSMPNQVPAQVTAQPDKMPRVHLITGPGTLPRNPKNRLEYLRYATTGESPLTGKELIERVPEVQKFARVTVESDELLPYDSPQQLKDLALK